MNVLFCASHPAHVHLFKNAIDQLRRDGHEVLVASREKDLTIDLLEAYELPHQPLWREGGSLMGHGVELVKYEVRLLRLARQFDPDVVVSRLNPAAAHVSSVLRCPNVVFDDDSEVAQLVGKLTNPFSDVICTPADFEVDLGSRQRRYDGFHELAYLHRDWFEPDPSVLSEFGIDVDEQYFVLRFVSWGAHHDVGQGGLSREMKRTIVSELAERGSVYITSEDPLPDEFEEYRLPIPPEHIHQLLYHADLYVGDSQTMATEAAVLGTPSVRSNTFAGGDDMSNFVTLEEEYDLLYSTGDEDRALELVRDLSTRTDIQEVWKQKRNKLLDDKIDVTQFMLDVIAEVGE
ncbi:DUF354 domain-containing protein [Natrialba sp. INN-245]|nr:DUF354 domain-containing protein [Natrialba sp. INN-245]